MPLARADLVVGTEYAIHADGDAAHEWNFDKAVRARFMGTEYEHGRDPWSHGHNYLIFEVAENGKVARLPRVTGVRSTWEEHAAELARRAGLAAGHEEARRAVKIACKQLGLTMHRTSWMASNRADGNPAIDVVTVGAEELIALAQLVEAASLADPLPDQVEEE